MSGGSGMEVQCLPAKAEAAGDKASLASSEDKPAAKDASKDRRNLSHGQVPFRIKCTWNRAPWNMQAWLWSEEQSPEEKPAESTSAKAGAAKKQATGAKPSSAEGKASWLHEIPKNTWSPHGLAARI